IPLRDRRGRPAVPLTHCGRSSLTAATRDCLHRPRGAVNLGHSSGPRLSHPIHSADSGCRGPPLRTNGGLAMRRSAFPCLLLGLVLAPPAAAQEKVATVEGVTEYRLANGARVLLYPEPSRPTITVNMTVLVGSRHEGYGESGMAHLLEHMVFKGTPTFPN